MNLINEYRTDKKSLLLIFVVFILARTVFMILMPNTYSLDLIGYLEVVDVFQKGGNPYRDTYYLNYWPPFWMQILYCISVTSKVSSISPTLLLLLLLIFIEWINILLCFKILKRFFNKQKFTTFFIFTMALNPISILLTCQHCNFDFILSFWVLLFCIGLMDFHLNHSIVSWLMACFFLGMGILTKTIPIILMPLLFAGIRNNNIATKLFGFLLLFSPVIIGMSILIALEPHVLKDTLTYRSFPGWYGITGIFNLMDEIHLINLYQKASPVIIISLVGYKSWRSYNINKLTISQIIIFSFLFLLFIPTFGPGYGPQYISWYLPLAVILYAISTENIQKILKIGYFIIALDYLIEYAFFITHGAFITKMIPTEQILSLSTFLTTQKMQVLIRLPMFLFYIFLFFSLLKSVKISETSQKFSS